jgi:branched-chain amino acid transport system substrate-binding protein
MKKLSPFVILGTILLGLAGCNTGVTPAPIIIGHVSDKTRLDKAGDQAELGIRLALHDVSKDDALENIFNGRKIQVHHTDAAGDPDRFEAQAVRLDSVNRCLALLGGLSAAETAALNHAKAPLLTFYGQPVSGAGNQVVYLGMSPARQGAVLAKVLAEDAKAMRITILIDEKRSEAIALADSFQKTLSEIRKDAKAPLATISTLRIGESLTWQDLLERMNQQEPHTVVFAGSVQDFNHWHKILRKEFVDAHPQIVYAGADGDQRRFDFDGDPTSVLLATAFFADPASEKITAFAKAFRESFQTEPDVHAALAYDGFRFLVEAMKRTPSQLTSEHVREELLKTKDFDGLTGPLTITPDREVLRPLFVVRWQNGALTAVKAFGP